MNQRGSCERVARGSAASCSQQQQTCEAPETRPRNALTARGATPTLSCPRARRDPARRAHISMGDVDLLFPPAELEKRRHKLKRLVQSPNSFFMDVKCPGCFSM